MSQRIGCVLYIHMGQWPKLVLLSGFMYMILSLGQQICTSGTDSSFRASQIMSICLIGPTYLVIFVFNFVYTFSFLFRFVLSINISSRKPNKWITQFEFYMTKLKGLRKLIIRFRLNRSIHETSSLFF